MEGLVILEKLKELMPVLERDFLVQRIGLFGSHAENRQSEHSDIDILVEFQKPIGWKVFSLEIFLEGVFKRKIDLVTPAALKSQIRDSVLRQVKYA
jgi:hypothetical protein